MYDIITFGSAAKDVFLESKGFEVKKEKNFYAGKGICVSLGSKIPVDNISFSIGGGATNAAFTFKNQGLKTAWCGMVGDDIIGKKIIDSLKRNGISTNFIFSTTKKSTNYSVILSTKDDRTILVYKGASGELKKEDIPWKKLKAKLFYLSPLSGKLVSVFGPIVEFAKENKIKVAVNPDNAQLALPKTKLKKLLSCVDVLILNQEEASLATGFSYEKEKEIFETLDSWVDGIVIMTKGSFGGVVSDGNYLYNFKTLKKAKIVDRTGVGDAFGSGFVYSILKFLSGESTDYKINPKDIERAIQFASANATSCLARFGAKNGLLKKGESALKWGKIEIERKNLK